MSQRSDAERWRSALEEVGDERVRLGRQATQQYLHQPDHLAFVLSRYRAARALVGNAESVLEIGCGEGIGAAILACDKLAYRGIDTDAEAIAVAQETWDGRLSQRVGHFSFAVADALDECGISAHPWLYRSVVLLDVIEHIPATQEEALLLAISWALAPEGVCVIGTPNAAAEHLASPQSRAGHVNLYSHQRLSELMERYFKRVQMFGMQDVALHLGHPELRHYLMTAGFGPRHLGPTNSGRLT